MKAVDGVLVLGYGPQPLDFFSNCMKITGKDSVIDTDVARMAGAVMAIGRRGALDELRGRLEAGALKRQEQETPHLSAAAIEWLAHGERGISSETIFSALTGVDALRGGWQSHPHDPSDLGRCIKLLDSVPELQPLMYKMMHVSPHWFGLMSRWDELVALYRHEKSIHGAISAPKTYQMMKSILESV